MMPFEPLRHPAYRRLWLGSLCLNLALWMQVVMAGWLMATMKGTPLEVGLIQTASTLPAFLLALPGGVIADLVERKRFLLTAQFCVVLVALLLAGLAFGDAIGPGLLLGLTFAFGLGFAVQGPSWFTSQLDVLPETSRLAAISLNSVSYSTARALGPAIAGLLMLWFSPAAIFAFVAGLNAISLALLLGIRPIPRHTFAGAVRETFGIALLNTLRYGRDSWPLQAQLGRILAFVLPGAALWALLPLLALHESAQAGSYGVLLGCLGVGAVIGALTLPVAHKCLRPRQIESMGALTYLVVSIATTAITALPVLVPMFVMAGVGWSWVGNLGLSTLQMQTEPHLRARALALYIIAFQGSMALGGALWGRLAELAGLNAALFVAAGLLLISVAISRSLPWAEARDDVSGTRLQDTA